MTANELARVIAEGEFIFDSYEQTVKELTKLLEPVMRERDELRAKLVQAETAGAEMRHAIQVFEGWTQDDLLKMNVTHSGGIGWTLGKDVHHKLVAALSSDCGRSILAELDRKTRALEFVRDECDDERMCKAARESLNPPQP